MRQSELVLCFLCLTSHALSYNELQLIDQSELFNVIPKSGPWDIVIQSPYRGIIEVSPSPVNKFQVLLNITSNSSTEERINYHLRKTEDSLVLELFARQPLTQSHSSVGDEEKVYLQLLLVTIAGLVLVVFVVSIIFSCWWIKSQKLEADDQSTQEVYYVKVPREVYEETEPSRKPSPDLDNQDDPEVIELSTRMVANQMAQQRIFADLPAAQLYISPTTAFATISMASNSDILLQGNPLSGPTTYPLPRYVVAGSGIGTSSNTLQQPTAGTPILFSTSPVASPDNAIAYLNLADLTGLGSPDVAGSIRMHTLPVRRHVATEFLDEAVLSTMTRARTKMDTPPQGQPISLHPQAPVIGAGGSSTSTVLPSVVFIPGDAANMFDPTKAMAAAVNVDLLPGSTAAQEFPMYSGLNLVEVISPDSMAALFPTAPVSSIQQHPAASSLPGQCSDETSGILSDSEGNTNPVLVNLAPTSLLTSVVNALGPLPHATRQVPLLAEVSVPASIPLANGSSQVGLSGVSSCPQHSHLVRRSQTEAQRKPDEVTADSTTGRPTSPTSGNANTVPGDEFALGSGNGVPGVPRPLTTGKETGEKTEDDKANRTAEAQSTLGRSRAGPNPPRRGVSLSPSQETNTDPDAKNAKTDNVSGKTSKRSPKLPEHKSATLGRTSTNGTLTEEDDSLTPGSSATLPGHGAGSSNPRSALKSADRSGPKVSKHLRFTTLSIIMFLWFVVVVALGSPTPPSSSSVPMTPHLVPWNVIKAPSSTGPEQESNNPTPFVKITIWLPENMIPSNNESHHYSVRTKQLEDHQAPESIQLWLNATSRTEVRLAAGIERSSVHIYDAVNAHQNLGTRVCRQRYACEHSCDPGARHDCICQRGYRPAGPQDRERLLMQGERLGHLDLESLQGRICLDVDECASVELRDECHRLGGVCTNRPGDYACLCPSGKPCRDCETPCPPGYWATGECGRNRSVECLPCSGPCPLGMYESQACSSRSDRICQACQPLCISEEFEFSPCKATSNRICKRKHLIPELVIPYKKNVWFENRQAVRDATFTIASDELGRLPPNRSILLDRGSGYQVRLDFDSLNLLPVLGPVDHSSGNDNNLFLASARHLDLTVTEPEAYRWSSANGHYMMGQAYTLKANNTLSRLCPYPVPPLYRLGLRVHRNVTTATVPDTSLPGHRPVLAPCRTYRRHGYFPPVDTNPAVGDPFDEQPRHGKSEHEPPVVVCLEPSRLPSIFGPHWNPELASPRAIYYEEKQLCSQLKSDCQHCLAACAEELKSNSLTCRPTPHPADNGRSPRLEICFDCCARDNCTDICGKYSAHRCHMQLCHYGLRLDFPLTPEWPKQGEFLCHVQPATSRPIYRLHWSLLYQGRPLTPDLFPAALHLPLPGNENRKGEKVDAHADTGRSGSLGHGGQLNHVYRGLLNIQYSSGLEHLPDMIGGTDTMQSAYFWSKQTIPLVAGSALNAAFDPSASAAATGALYASAVQAGPSATDMASLQVWPSTPLGVSTASWARLSGAPCAAADPLLEQLNIYTPALPPYIAMGEAKVEYIGNYLYTVSHSKTKPKLTLSLPKSASLLGAVFSPASVERGHYLRATLALAWIGQQSGEEEPVNGVQRSRYWVIDLTGQVDQFPGLFRLRVYPEPDEAGKQSDATVEIVDDNAYFGEGVSYSPGLDDLPDEEPLLDYDIGVFEERKFQLRILIPGPEHEPDYEKTFRLSINDEKNRLDIYVKRKVQPPEDMLLRRSYERLTEDDARPSLTDLLPSLTAHQDQSSDDAQQQPTTDDLPFGPPASAVYTVLLSLVVLVLCLMIGIATKPDYTMAWLRYHPKDKSAPPLTDENGDHLVIISNPGSTSSLLSQWFRVFLLIGYLCLKSAYTFGITLTTLVIVIRFVTRHPSNQLANLPEWNGAGQTDEFLSTSRTKQKLLQDAMDIHLKGELQRQQNEVRRMREACDRGTARMHEQLEERLGAASKVASSRRSRVLLSQGVAELARVTAVSSALQLAEGLMSFNQSADWALQRLRSDLVEAERALGSSDWLTGARIIYAEVVRLRGLSPDPTDPTRSFLEWARLLPRGQSTEDNRLPQLQTPSLLSLLQSDQFEIVPPVLRNPSVAAEEEPEYGPPYVPYVSGPVNLESHETFFTDQQPHTETNPPESWNFDDPPAEEQKTPNDQPIQQEATSLFSKVQLGWVHILGAALLLDALWLIHRVLHTVDTAERLLYGDAVFIDLTAEGLRRRLNRKSSLRDAFKRVFETAMQPGSVRKICGTVLSLLLVTQGAAHLDRLLSEGTLDYVGYYDNLILPVHLHARLVNAHVTRSAQRLTQYEVAGLESEISRQYREAQKFLQHWTGWLRDIEQEQCRILLAYKTAAQEVRTKMAGKLQRNPALGKLHFPIHLIHSTDRSRTSDQSTEAYVPRHCRMTQSELDVEMAEANRLQAPTCPLDAVIPQLFKGYNASEYFEEVVRQSEVWLGAARQYASRLFYCLFIYVSCLILWNVAGSVVWIYLTRLNILPKKVLYESDLSSWVPPTTKDTPSAQ